MTLATAGLAITAMAGVFASPANAQSCDSNYFNNSSSIKRTLRRALTQRAFNGNYGYSPYSQPYYGTNVYGSAYNPYTYSPYNTYNSYSPYVGSVGTGLVNRILNWF